MALQPESLVGVLKAVGEETRLRLVALLASGERSVKDLTSILSQSQPRISRHLRLLTESGVIKRTQEGAWVYYRLSDEPNIRSLVDAALASLDVDDPVVRRDGRRLEQLIRESRDRADRYFAENAANWDRVSTLHVPESQVETALLDAAGPGPYRALLDIGTGTGRMLELFADRYETGLGVDRSQAMLAIARRNLEKAGISHAAVRTGDVMSLSARDGLFERVVIHQVLHFLDDPEAAIAHAARVLAPGGRLLIADFASHDVEFLRSGHAHRRLGFSPEQIRRWTDAAGLIIEGSVALPPGDQLEPGLTVSIWCAVRK